MVNLSVSSSSASHSRKFIEPKAGVVETKIIASQQHKYNYLDLAIGIWRARVQGLQSGDWALTCGILYYLQIESDRIELN